MKIAEERLPLAVTLAESEEFSVQRVGEIASRATLGERVGGPIEVRSLFEDEMLPRPVVSGRARARQREIFEVQAAEVAFELFTLRVAPNERAPGARFECFGEALPRHTPSLAACLEVQALDKRCGDRQPHGNRLPRFESGEREDSALT